MNPFKNLSASVAMLACVATLAVLPLASPPNAAAADWSLGYGQANTENNPGFAIAGVPLAVIPSVQSNTVYAILGADSSGGATIDSVRLVNDFVSGNVDFYVSTNYWICASNQPAGTNIIWLTSTNAGLATNDLLVLESQGGSDSVQLMLLSGNATDAAGLVYTNSSGYTAVKVWNTPTNAIVAGDRLHKLARVQRFTPLQMGSVTNQIIAVPSAHFGQWVTLGPRESPIKFRAKIGQVSAVVMTYSNAASLWIEGRFETLPRR